MLQLKLFRQGGRDIPTRVRGLCGMGGDGWHKRHKKDGYSLAWWNCTDWAIAFWEALTGETLNGGTVGGTGGIDSPGALVGNIEERNWHSPTRRESPHKNRPGVGGGTSAQASSGSKDGSNPSSSSGNSGS